MSSLSQLVSEDYGQQIRDNNSFNSYNFNPKLENSTSNPISNPHLNSKVIELTDFIKPDNMNKLENIILNSKFSTIDYENGEKKTYFKLEDRFKNLQSFFDENNFNFIDYEKADFNSLVQIYDKLKTYESKFKTPNFAEKKNILFDYTKLMGNLKTYIKNASENQGFSVILDTEIKSNNVNRLYDILNYKIKDAPWLIKDSVTKTGKHKKGRITYLKEEVEKIVANKNFNSQDLLDLNYFKEDLEKLRLGKYKKHSDELLGLENIISEVQENYSKDFMISKDYFKQKRIMTKENRYIFNYCNIYSQELSKRYQIFPMNMYKALIFGSSSDGGKFKQNMLKNVLNEIFTERKNSLDQILNEKVNSSFIVLVNYIQNNCSSLFYEENPKLNLDKNSKNKLQGDILDFLLKNKTYSKYYSKTQLRSLSGIFLNSSNIFQKYDNQIEIQREALISKLLSDLKINSDIKNYNKSKLDLIAKKLLNKCNNLYHGDKQLLQKEFKPKIFMDACEIEFKNTIKKYWEQDDLMLHEDIEKFNIYAQRMNKFKNKSFLN